MPYIRTGPELVNNAQIRGLLQTIMRAVAAFAWTTAGSPLSADESLISGRHGGYAAQRTGNQYCWMSALGVGGVAPSPTSDESMAIMTLGIRE